MNSTRLWSFVLVEDDEQVREEVTDLLHGEEFSFGTVDLVSLGDFESALPLLQQRKVDLLILDVRSDHDQNKTAGIRVLEKWRSTGFSPVIFYTALPESVTDYEGPLVKVVAKEGEGFTRLLEVINEFFRLRIPQTYKAIMEHFDFALRDYMWGFVVQNWSKLQILIDQPDFVRLLLRRLAAQFSREGVGRVIESLYPGLEASEGGVERVHPTEYYIKPPIGTDPQLGDIRRLQGELFVVVWPSCDLVLRESSCKVERALCAKARPLTDFEEYQDWSTSSSSNNKKQYLVNLMTNNKRGGQAERYHFLPGAWDIPAIVLDFQDLRHVEVSELRQAECLATIASPFAESISTRFTRYVGRIGTPDLDVEAAFKSIAGKR